MINESAVDGKTGRKFYLAYPQNIGAYNKFITGTWAVGNQKGEFKVVRN